MRRFCDARLVRRPPPQHEATWPLAWAEVLPRSLK